MSADAHSPAFISYHIVDALIAGMTSCFQSIPAEGTGSCHSVAGSDIDRIGSVSDMECARELPCLWCFGIRPWRNGKTEPSDWQGFRYGFEGDSWYPVCEAEHRTDGSSEGMAGQPHVGIRVELRYIGVQLPRSLIIPVLVPESVGDAGVVARVSPGRAVAHWPHRPRGLLSAAAAEEQVIVDLVVGRRAISVKHSGRGPLQSDDDSRVILVSPDMTTQTVSFPAKVSAPVERLANILPVGLPWLLNICVGRHQSQAQDGVFVCHVRCWDVVHGPRIG